MTDPKGTVFDVSVHLAPTKTAYISESKQGLHVFGWDPRSKRLEVQSFMPDGTRASAWYGRKSDNQVSGRSGKMIGPDGTEQPLGEGIFTIIDKDTYHFSFGELKWTSKRKQGR
jgi:hypothetical protein